MTRYPAVEAGVVETPTARLAYDCAGAGDAVVLVHSGITDRRMWDPLFSTLAERYRTVRYDMQGFGDSVAVADGTNREELLALLDALGVDRAHVVACSFGASVALDAALEHPERFRTLTLVGPTVGGHEFDEPDDSAVWDRVEELYEASVDAFAAGRYREAAEHEVALWVVGPERETQTVDASVREWVIEMDEAALWDEAAGRRADATDLDPPAIDRLETLAVPLFVLVGEFDLAIVSDAVRILVERAPDVRHSVVAGTAHLPSVERPDTVLDRLAEFWDGVAEGTT